jgi:signal transduction histidine kinase
MSSRETSNSDLPDRLAKNLSEAGSIFDSDSIRAHTLASEAREWARELGDDIALAKSTWLMAWTNYRLSNFEQARIEASEALNLFRQSAHLKGEADCLKIIGTIAWATSDYPTALQNLKASIIIYQSIKDLDGEATSLNNLGNVYDRLNNFSDALQCFETSLKIRRDTNNKRREIAPLGNIGGIYFSLGQYEKAKQYHHEALSLSKEIKDRRTEVYARCNIGACELKLNHTHEACEQFEICLRICHDINDQYIQGISLRNLGFAYQKLGRTKEAFASLDQALKVFQKNENKSQEVGVWLTFGTCYLDIDDILHASHALNQGIAIAEAVGDRANLRELYKARSKAEERLGNLSAAFANYKRFHELEQESFNDELKSRLANFDALRQIEVRRIEAEQYQKRIEELAKANQLKNELLSIAAHDLKNPLQSVMGCSELIQERVPTVSEESMEKIDMFAKAIYGSSQRMLTLINDLLKTSALDIGKLELEKMPVTLSTLLEAVIFSMYHQITQKSQTIEFISDANCTAEADAGRLIEVFENLISNAVKYSPNGKKIVVKMKRYEAGENKTLTPHTTEATILIAVQDEGLGLTDEDKLKLFGKFQRLSARPTGGESSTGLGLAIVKQLVELHQGRVWAESEGENKGTTFYVELPAL